MPLRENIFQDNRGEKTYFMTGLGTIINTVAIIVGGIIGHFTGRLFKQEQQAALNKACGISVLFIAIAEAI